MDWQSRNPGPNRRPPGPCHFFQRNGWCRFGNNCRYSHATPGYQQQARDNNHHDDQNRQHNHREDKLREWKRLLAQGAQSSRLNDTTVGLFFKLSLELMEGDIGATQEAVRLLVTEAGLNFVKAITDHHVSETSNDHTRLVVWDSLVTRLLQLLTHERLVDSNVLELEVAALYSFLVGANAVRMESLFRFVLDTVANWSSMYTLSQMGALELSLAVLSRAVDCSTTNTVNDKFQQVVQQFSDILTALPTTHDDPSRLRAMKCLDYLQRRLGVGKTMADAAGPRPAAAQKEVFVLRRDLPGELSTEGRRHDNDYAEISKIQIMPTYQEITTPRNEYLPTTDSSQWHIGGIRGRLDREFRLLREDTVGQLRDAVHDMLQRIRSPDQRHQRQSQNSARTSSYSDAFVHGVEMDRNKGIELIVRCNQPDLTQKMNESARQAWWEQCKRLQAGALTCVLDAAGMIQFYVVADSTLRTLSAKDRKSRPAGPEDNDQRDAGDKPLTLSFSREFLYVRLNLVKTSAANLGSALRWYRDTGASPRRYMVEFPGVLLSSFKHTLEALQKLSQKPNLPFTDLIAPETPTQALQVDCSAPLFARGAGFEFDLACLTENKQPFSASLGRLPSAEEVSAKTSLDKTQSEALLNTLVRELSLIQGPPGTGKSYTGEKIIQVLLANKARARLGPIICVCYTNHALDQVLEHLLDEGITGIIRMGSRSKSERLDGLNLRAISQKAALTKPERSQMYHLHKKMEDLGVQITEQLGRLSSCEKLRSIRAYLEISNPAHFAELFSTRATGDSEGWKVVEDQHRNVIDTWRRGGVQPNAPHGSNPRDLADLQSVRLDEMTRMERLRLYRSWLKEIQDTLVTQIVALHQEHEEAKEQRTRIRKEEDFRCLQQADIIGLTTTGLAREIDLMRKLRSKVVICEEAGEVLEAHLLTALLPSVEHAILIGDHLQLRPQIQNYDLQSTNPRGLQYSLDTSLFERLVQPPHLGDLRLPVSVLETQRRMHPSIAEMVRSTLYPALKDAENVCRYPEIVGMGRRLFWLHHEQLEAGASASDPHDTSHSNEYEIGMTAALVSHLVKQGSYDPEDIAVLTPYLGQLHKLRARLAAEATFAVNIGERDLKELEELDVPNVREQAQTQSQPVAKTTLLRSIRLATVDNFQGEEAKVVIISLVRSNPQNRCGFLSTPNRINVLLSRAKHGCYIIGNSTTCQHVPMWGQIIELLQDNGDFGTSLELQCPRHPARPTLVSQPDHFAAFAPDGGCLVPCDRRLGCGHACYGPCHSDLLHQTVKCHQKCPRQREGCDHACPRECGDPCEDRCNARLEDISLRLSCGHTVSSARCWEAQNPAVIRCQHKVDREVAGCGHTISVACHADVNSSSFQCTVDCGTILSCGHKCGRLCCQCNSRILGSWKDEEVARAVETEHGKCPQKCGRNYTTCPHTCQQTCHGETKCSPCNQPCEARCSHSRCSKPCHEPCAPCAAEDCASHCPHTKCSMPCAAPCDWVPCSRRCTSVLACGHQCPSLCGEACPDEKYCQQCGSDDILSTVVDYLMMSEYKDIDLDEDPCIFASCGHFLTKSSMDGQMGVGEYYEVDENGSPTAIKGPLQPFALDGAPLKSCPQCRGSLRNISRYGRIVRRALLDEATKKFISWSEDENLQLTELLLEEEQRLEQDQAETPKGIGRLDNIVLTGPILVQLTRLRDGVGRYGRLVRLYKRINGHRVRVRFEEQPFQRVANFVKHANRSKNVGPYSLHSTVVQLRGYMVATSLLLKCNIAILLDFSNIWKEAKPANSTIPVDFSDNMEQCQELIQLAVETDRPRFEAEGHIYYAQLCSLALALGDFPPEKPSGGTPFAVPGTDAGPEQSERERLKDTGLAHVARAHELLNDRHWDSKEAMEGLMETQLEAAENILNGGQFYRPVTAAEMRAVYNAMAKQFLGSGHWYYCENGHPFTVGECGLPMEQARCFECGSPVGGQNHTPAAGVRHATEMEDLARGIDAAGI